MRLRTPEEFKLEIEKLKVKILKWGFDVQSKQRGPVWGVLYNVLRVGVVLLAIIGVRFLIHALFN